MGTLGAARALLALALAADSSPQALPAAGEQPTFRSGTNLVQVDAIVRDARGRFVYDLMASDFEILEDGKSQAIDAVYLVDNGVGSDPREPPPAVRVDRVSGRPRVFVWVFDDEHLLPGSFRRAQSALEAILADPQHFATGDVGGIVLNGTLAGGGLTTSREELVARLRAGKSKVDARSRHFDIQSWPRLAGEDEAARIDGGDRLALAEAVKRAMVEEPGRCREPDDCQPFVLQKAQQVARELHAGTDRTLRVLSAVAAGLGRIEGRKTLVLVTDGFLVDRSVAELRDVIGRAARAGITIYALDARGLDRSPASHDPAAPTAGPTLPQFGGVQLDSSQDGANSLAVDTGGFVIRNTNRLDAGLGEIARDAGTYYVISYAPSNLVLDGSFRRIGVKVRQPGLTVRARRGYVAADALPSILARARVPAPRQFPPPAIAPESGTRPPLIPPPTPPSEAATASAAAGVKPESPAAAETAGGPSAAGATTAAELRLRPDATANVQRLLAAATVNADARAGWASYQRGDLEGARRSFRAATSSASPAWVYYALGQSEYALGGYRDAVRAWERVRADAPEFEPVYFDLVDGYLQLKELGPAVATLREAEQRWPRDTEVLNALGVVQTHRGALDDAIASFRKATEIDPGDAIACFNLAKAHEMRYYRSRRYAQAARSWVANEDDLRAAAQYYRRYLEIGGPLEASAREGLERLTWAK